MLSDCPPLILFFFVFVNEGNGETREREPGRSTATTHGRHHLPAKQLQTAITVVVNMTTPSRSATTASSTLTRGVDDTGDERGK